MAGSDFHVFAGVSEDSVRNPLGTPLSQKGKQRHKEVRRGGCGMNSRAGSDYDVTSK